MARINPASAADIESGHRQPALSEADFVNKYIPYRQCKQCVENDKNPGFCKCGYEIEAHSVKLQYNKLPSNTPWTQHEHTKRVYGKANAFGEIEFSSEQKPARYIRADARMIDDSMHHVTDLMLNHWGLKVPNLIITVTGGATSFNLSRQLSQKFRQGIVRAAQSTGAWIITGGTYTGVMKHTGKAVRDCAIQRSGLNEIVCIGIAAWGVVRDRRKLISNTYNGQFSPNPAKYTVSKTDPPPNGPDSKLAYIDPNHTHFILVDNGIHGSAAFGSEIKFRTELERRISQMSPSTDKSVNVPVCCVMLQGGPGSLTTAYEAVKAGTPVVVVKDSGMMANVLADGYLSSSWEEREVKDDKGETIKKTVTKMTDALRQQIKNQLMAEMNTKDEEKLNDWLKKVEECLESRDLITIYQLDTFNVSSDLDVAILLALFKAKKEQISTQLKLSLAWNRVDISKTYLFSEDRRWARRFFDEVAYTAFCNDRVEFLKLFIKHGLNLKDFLSIHRLAKLYHETPNDSFLRRMLTERKDSDGIRRPIGYNSGNQILCLKHVGELLDNIFGDLLGHPYCDDDRYSRIDTARLLELANEDPSANKQKPNLGGKPDADRPNSQLSNRKHTVHVDEPVKGVSHQLTSQKPPKKQQLSHEEWLDKLHRQALDEKNRRRIRKSPELNEKVSHFDDPAFDLFVYCILLNRRELAEVCFEEVREAIPAALTAVQIYRVMADQADDNEAQAEFEENGKYFETMAFEILSECFEASPADAQQLLTRKIGVLKDRTCLGIAQSSNAIRFISHPCCQRLFNSLWYGKILDSSSAKTVALVAGSCFVPPLIFALKYERVKKTEVSSDKKATPARSNPKIKLQSDGETPEPVNINGLEPKEVRMFESNEILATIAYFYNAPFVVFIHTIMSYICFLLLMSYDILIVYPSNGLNWSSNAAEIILVIYVATLFLEQIHAALNAGSGSKQYFIYRHVTNSWNLLELFAILFFVLAMILGNISNVTLQTVNAGRIFYAFSIMLFFFRILHWYAIDQNLGPKVVMVGRMLLDMISFMGILLIFVFAWGVAQYALLFPKSVAQWTLIRDVLVLPYWQMFAQFYFNVMRQQPFDIPDPSQCTNDPSLYSNYTSIRCSDETGQWVVPILLAVFVMLTNLLLFNLLIAIFANTFSSVQLETDQHWSYQRFELISEFNSKPPLVPPFIIISHIFIMIKAIHRHRKGFTYRRCKVNNSFKERLDRRVDNKRRMWMNAMKDEFLKKKRVGDDQKIDSQIRSMNKKMREVSSVMPKLAALPREAAEKHWPLTVKLQSMNSRPDRKQIEDAVAGEKKSVDTAKGRIYNELKKTAENADLTAKMLQSILKMVDNVVKQIPFSEGSLVTRPAFERQRSARASSRKAVVMHKKALTTLYPSLNVERFVVPSNKISWDAQFKRYKPVLCQSDEDFLRNIFLAWDPDLLSLPPQARTLTFNQYDSMANCNRMASVFYCVKDGVPLNPIGRTGVTGRGLLARWGPNHSLMCAVLRRKLQQVGDGWQQVMSHNRPVLEVFVQVSNRANPTFSMSMIESPGVNALAFMQSLLQTKLQNNETLDDEVRQRLSDRLQQCFSRRGKVVYSGYLDDEVNTDNAWIETQCVGIYLPDDVGQAISNEADMFEWSEITALKVTNQDDYFRLMLRQIAEQFGGYN